MKRLLALLSQPVTGDFLASIRKRNGRYKAQVRIGSASKLASVLLKAEARLGGRRRRRSLFIVEGVRQVYADGYGQRGR